MVWGLTAHGEYSVQSGARLLQGHGIHVTPKVSFKWIWKCNVPPKTKFFIWKICLDRLPTKDRLERSHVFTAQECVFCNFHKESDDHLFYECDFAKKVFTKIKESLCWPGIPSFDRSFRMGENIASIAG